MKQKQTWIDVYLGKYKWYRRLRKGCWYKHQFTKDAQELSFLPGKTWWARYREINRYSIVIAIETYSNETIKSEIYCPSCNESENIHFNVDYSDYGSQDTKEFLCNECGTFFTSKLE
jgi:hypothetical protein